MSSTCTSCNYDIPADARFCAGCGRKVGSSLSLRAVIAIVSCGVATFGALFWLQGKLAGTMPVASHAAMASSSNQGYKDPEIEKLRVQAEAAPDSINNWRSLAEKLAASALAGPDADRELVFGLIDALAQILRLDPRDGQALLTMANLTFNQKAFTKSAEYFERYLQVAPDDLDARATYGSTLAFLGKYDAALNEITTVQTKDPKHFQAAAYRAIIAAERGDKTAALTLGEQALTLAPHEDARARFSAFLQSLSTAPSGAEPTHQAGESAVATFLKTNPVAGPKFVSASPVGSALVVTMREFPMEQMPPFAKDKFLSGLRAALEKEPSTLTEVRIIDAASGKTMHSEARQK